MHPANHTFVAGQLQILREKQIGSPNAGVEPVDRQQQKTEQLEPDVAVPDMGLLMQQDIGEILSACAEREIDLWTDQPEHKRRCGGIRLVDVPGHANRRGEPPALAQALDEQIADHARGSGKPNPCDGVRP